MKRSTLPPWYPGDAQTTAIHAHWLLNDGQIPTPLSGNPAQTELLRKCASSLASYTPTQIWQDAQSFADAAHLLIAYFGLEDHDEGHKLSQTARPPFLPGRWLLDIDRIQSELGVKFANPRIWVDSLDVWSDRAKESGQSWSYAQMWWEAGCLAKAQVGHYIKPLPSQRGHTPYDRLAQYLTDNVSFVERMDAFAQDFSKDEVLSVVLYNGFVDDAGVVQDRRWCQLNKDSVLDYFGESLEGSSKEERFTHFRQHLFPAVFQAFIRRCVHIRKDHKVKTGEPLLYQANYILTVPTAYDPTDALACMHQFCDERSSHLRIGHELERDRTGFCWPSRGETSVTADPHNPIIIEETSRLERVSSVIAASHARLRASYVEWKLSPARILVAPAISSPLVSFKRYIKWETGTALVEGEAGEAGDGTIAGLAAKSYEMEADDGLFVLEDTAELSSDQLGPTQPELTGLPLNNHPKHCPFDTWRRLYDQEIDTLLGNQKIQLFNLSRAIHQRLRTGHEDEGFIFGLNKRWMRPDLSADVLDNLAKQGYETLRECPSFGRPLWISNSASISALLHMHPDKFDPSFVHQLVDQLSFILSAAMISPRFFLFTTATDHTLDILTAKWDAAARSKSMPSVQLNEGLGVLASIKGFAQGLLLSATVGNRTFLRTDGLRPVFGFVLYYTPRLASLVDLSDMGVDCLAGNAVYEDVLYCTQLKSTKRAVSPESSGELSSGNDYQ